MDCFLKKSYVQKKKSQLTANGYQKHVFFLNLNLYHLKKNEICFKAIVLPNCVTVDRVLILKRESAAFMSSG